MVQMKDVMIRTNHPNCACLYIPHGSDERKIAGIIALVALAFISHMVQMKVIRT